MMGDDNNFVHSCDCDPEVWRDRLTMLQLARASGGSDDETGMAVEVIDRLSLGEAQNLIAISAQLLMAAWSSMNDGIDYKTDMFMDGLEKAFADGSS